MYFSFVHLLPVLFVPMLHVVLVCLPSFFTCSWFCVYMYMSHLSDQVTQKDTKKVFLINMYVSHLEDKITPKYTIKRNVYCMWEKKWWETHVKYMRDRCCMTECQVIMNNPRKSTTLWLSCNYLIQNPCQF